MAWRALQALLPASRFEQAPLAERLLLLAAHGRAILALAVLLDRYVEKPARAALVRLGERWWPAPAPGRSRAA